MLGGELYCPSRDVSSPHLLTIIGLGKFVACLASTAEDIGNACVFLASEDSRNINGETIYIDGGQPLKGE